MIKKALDSIMRMYDLTRPRKSSMRSETQGDRDLDSPEGDNGASFDSPLIDWGQSKLK